MCRRHSIVTIIIGIMSIIIKYRRLDPARRRACNDTVTQHSRLSPGCCEFALNIFFKRRVDRHSWSSHPIVPRSPFAIHPTADSPSSTLSIPCTLPLLLRTPTELFFRICFNDPRFAPPPSSYSTFPRRSTLATQYINRRSFPFRSPSLPPTLILLARTPCLP